MHAANVAAHPRAGLAGVYDIAADAAEAAGQALGARVFRSAEEAFASADVDAVLIATATATHCDYIEAAVGAGKPVLCEKPLDLSLDRVNLCRNRIGDTDLPIMLGFVRRFDAGHRAARQALLDGEIGELHQVIITSRDPGLSSDDYIEVSGGIFRDMTIHDLDLARFMPERLPGRLGGVGGDVIDTGQPGARVRRDVRGVHDADPTASKHRKSRHGPILPDSPPTGNRAVRKRTGCDTRSTRSGRRRDRAAPETRITFLRPTAGKSSGIRVTSVTERTGSRRPGRKALGTGLRRIAPCPTSSIRAPP